MTGIYELLSSWKIKVSLREDMRSQGYGFPDDRIKTLHIHIRSSLEEKERVVTFLHELFHTDTGEYPDWQKDGYEDRFRAFMKKHTGHDSERTVYDGPRKYALIERAIDEAAYRTYDSHPRLMEFLVKKYHLDAQAIAVETI